MLYKVHVTRQRLEQHLCFIVYNFLSNRSALEIEHKDIKNKDFTLSNFPFLYMSKTSRHRKNESCNGVFLDKHR